MFLKSCIKDNDLLAVKGSFSRIARFPGGDNCILVKLLKGLLSYGVVAENAVTTASGS